MLAIIKDIKKNDNNFEDNSYEHNLQESVNSAIHLSVQTETLKVLAQLQQQLQNLIDQVGNNKSVVEIGNIKRHQIMLHSTGTTLNFIVGLMARVITILICAHVIPQSTKRSH